MDINQRHRESSNSADSCTLQDQDAIKHSNISYVTNVDILEISNSNKSINNLMEAKESDALLTDNIENSEETKITESCRNFEENSPNSSVEDSAYIKSKEDHRDSTYETKEDDNFCRERSDSTHKKTKENNDSCKDHKDSTHKKVEDEHDSHKDELTHSEMKEVFHKALDEMLSSDSILGDLHSDLTYQEVSQLLEVEAGRSMLVVVQRADGGAWQVRIPRDARLHQLKAALKTHVTLTMHREGCKRSLSWRSVWRRHWLTNRDDLPLTDDNATLASLGVAHKDTISFKKKSRNKFTHR